jgi:hypothetical protein
MGQASDLSGGIWQSKLGLYHEWRNISSSKKPCGISLKLDT